jgi:cytochrome c-type biogenesis protein CcsB
MKEMKEDQMNSSLVLAIVTFGYGVSAFLYLFYWIFKKQAVSRPAHWIAMAGVVGNGAGIIMRWTESHALGIGHAPFSNLYESLVFFAGTIVMVFLLIDRKYKVPVLGAVSVPLAFWALAYASLSPNITKQIQPLIPALQSNWLIAHVITCFVGYAAFAVGCGVSILYLLKKRKQHVTARLTDLLPDGEVMDSISYQLVMYGFLLLTIGIVSGAVWANSAWGRYWGWDPKETWSLITWIIYAVLLHARNIRGWRGRKIAYLSIIGFLAVLFTYFGVNYLPGLHSYGQV